MGKITEKQLCIEFGLCRPKNYDEGYGEGEIPEFRVIRLVSAASGKPIHDHMQLRRKRILMRQTCVAVPFSLELNIDEQLSLARSMLKDEMAAHKASGHLKLAPRKFGKLKKFSEFLARALTAYHFRGYGPTKLGVVMFPDHERGFAKTKARDLINRGHEFVEHGYLSLVMHARRKVREKAKQEEAQAKWGIGLVRVR
jgi:hypothetical protein